MKKITYHCDVAGCAAEKQVEGDMLPGAWLSISIYRISGNKKEEHLLICSEHADEVLAILGKH